MMTPEDKRHDMLHSPVELLVCKMAVPTIITMLITALYNMADTYFVGRLTRFPRLPWDWLCRL